MPPRATYIHVPFCRHRCGYCDFTLIAGRDDLVEAYLRTLQRELRFHPHDPATGPTEVDTLFFGGGTPTHPEPAALGRMLQLVLERFTLVPGGEFSVEANPLDLTPEKVTVLRAAGVNRISLGVQSFHKTTLKLLERDHTADEAQRAVDAALSITPNVSLDLIFGVPGQSLDEWVADLRRAIALGIPHVSTYGLTFESGTAFETRRKRGELARTPEDLEVAMYAAAMDELGAAGFEHYEISNFARPGFACRHNQTYWRADEYVAYGPGAARYVNGRRETNIRSTLGWLARLERGVSPVVDAEELEPEHKARERIFLGLRTQDGIARQRFFEQTGFALDDLVGSEIHANLARGWLADDGESIRLTREGRFVADRVVQDFL